MPTFQNTTSQESLKVFLNSAQASISQSDSHMFFHLKDKIRTLSGHHIKLSVLDAEIPFSFYQTNSTNNVVSGSIGGSAFSFTISAGNYRTNEGRQGIFAQKHPIFLCKIVQKTYLWRCDFPSKNVSFCLRSLVKTYLWGGYPSAPPSAVMPRLF